MFMKLIKSITMGLIRDYKQASIVYTIWHILLRAHFQLRHDMYTITSTFPTHFVGHSTL
jgi:hypothetical protein